MTRLVLALAGASVLVPSAASAQDQRTVISPHIEVGQVLIADLQDGDVLTYSTIGAGVDASIQTKRVEVQLSYQYERRISYDDNIGDDDVHSGLARVAVAVTPGFSVEGGAIATRARSDIRGAAPIVLAGNVDNISQVYSAYVGPTVATRVGAADVNAAYRFGYTKAEAPGFTGVGPGAVPLDTYDSSTSHLVTASAGVKAGAVLPVGVTVSGAYEREDADQLDQSYEGLYLRGDVVVPLNSDLAAVGGVGYENINIQQRDALLDGNGNPVIDGRGRFVTDPASPPRIAYDFDGIYYDAGVIWRPSPRTALEARIGERYGSLSVTGSLSYQTGPASGLQVGVYDSVQSFGRQLNQALATLPTTGYINGDTPFADGYNGCLFGAGSNGGVGGGCLNGAFQSIATANYRARGIDAVWAASRGGTRIGVGAGYANRRFYAPDRAPGFSVNGLNDESYYAQAFAAQALDSQSTVTGNLFANYYKSGATGGGDVFGAGATGAYVRTFGRLAAQVSAGIYTYDQDGADNSDVTAQGLIGLGYRF